MSVYLTGSQITAIHDLQSSQPVRDPSALEAAAARPLSGWGPERLYPDISDQAAILLISLCQAQAFVDGNKRTAWVSMDVYLQLNGHTLGPITDNDILDVMNGISVHSLGDAEVVMWIKHHVTTADPTESAT